MRVRGGGQSVRNGSSAPGAGHAVPLAPRASPHTPTLRHASCGHPAAPRSPGGEPLPYPRSPRRHTRPPNSAKLHATPQNSPLNGQLGVGKMRRVPATPQCPPPPPGPSWRGARLLPALPAREGSGAGAQRAGGRPRLRGASSCGWSASRAGHSDAASALAPRASRSSSPLRAPLLPLALGRLSRSRLLLRALPANFPGPAGAPRSRQAGPLQTAGRRLAAPWVPSPRPRRALQRPAPCPGPGAEAQPRRDGWVLGFWVRQPPPAPFSLGGDTRKSSAWDGVCAARSEPAASGVLPSALGLRPPLPRRTARPPRQELVLCCFRRLLWS